MFSKIRREVKTIHLQAIGGDGSSWGDVAATLESLRKTNIRDFNEHSVYLLQDKYKADSSTWKLFSAFSTNNLLLNAYRQVQCGQDVFFGIDTSYRYNNKKCGLMPIKTLTLTQEGKTIAYGFVSNEDKTAHTFVLEIVKQSVEDIVNDLVRTGITHI